MKESFEILAIITKNYPVKKRHEILYNIDGRNFFNFQKVLKKDTVYKLNNNYSIGFNEISSIVKIEKNKDHQLDLYSNKKQFIQVNAIVGKNGSGKSTLSEILYLMLYNLAIDQKIINDLENNKIAIHKGFLNAILVLKKNDVFQCVDFEILDYVEDTFSMEKDSKNVSYFHGGKLKKGVCEFDLNNKSDPKIDVKDLLYMISMNYSMYGLNELKMGQWIKNIFHKNDMYDTPIVINPYRENGVIDINTEDTQNNARVISNLTKRNYSSGNSLSKDYRFKDLTVTYNRINRKKAYITDELLNYVSKEFLMLSESLNINNKISIAKGYSPYDFFPNGEETYSVKQIFIDNVNDRLFYINDLASFLLQNSKSAFQAIHSYFYNIESDQNLKSISLNLNVPENDIIIDDLFSYFIYKLYRIGYNYPKDFGSLLNEKRDGFNSGSNFDKALKYSLTSNSHACFKLKRVYYFINFLKGEDRLKFKFKKGAIDAYNILWEMNELNRDIPETLNYLNEQKGKAFRLKHKNDNFNDIDYHYFSENDLAWRLPPSIFYTNCVLVKNKNEPRTYNLNELSSGETQFIYSLQTILYHIINLESNEEYSNVTILLDEIELYYHPEYQRVFLSTLLKQIEELTLSKITSIQIILLTHSPFILSDIPATNVLRLSLDKDNHSIPELNDSETFGANIHELLANDFFLESGFIGDFAKKFIENIFNELYTRGQNDILSRSEYLKYKEKINLIGERIIKIRLTDLLNEIARENLNLEDEINEAEKHLNDLKKKRDAKS